MQALIVAVMAFAAGIGVLRLSVGYESYVLLTGGLALLLAGAGLLLRHDARSSA